MIDSKRGKMTKELLKAPVFAHSVGKFTLKGGKKYADIQ